MGRVEGSPLPIHEWLMFMVNLLVNMWVFPQIVVPQNGWLMMENPIKIHDFPGFEWVFIPWGSWLTETENGFMEVYGSYKYYSFRFGDCTPLAHPMTFGEPGSLGFGTEFLGVGLSPSNVS